MIKRPGPDDLDTLMALWLDTNVSAHPFIPRLFWEGAYEQVKSALPSAELFAWQEAGKIMGFIGVTGGVYVAGLFVGRQYQSRGIGQALISCCKRLYPRLELDVFAENVRALRFYNKNGFTVVKTGMNPHAGHEECRMVWQS